MDTINAQTIINKAMAAHAVAPENDHCHTDAAREFMRITHQGSGFFCDEGIRAGCGPMVDYLADQENNLVYAEFYDALQLPALKIKFQTSAKGFHTIKNCRENLQRFADLVRKNAAAFGGGLIRIAKDKPAISYPAKSISLFKQLLEDHDYSAALELASDKLGALFFVDNKGRALLQVAPVPVESMPGLSSVMNETGTFSIIEPMSMRGFGGVKRSRAAQIEACQHQYDTATPESKARILSEAESLRVDQAAIRSQWLIEHGLNDAEAIAARIEAEDTARHEAMAAQDVAEVVAQAVANIAISEAMADSAEPALCEAVAELATCETGHDNAPTCTMGQAGDFHATASNTYRRALRKDVVLLNGAIVKHSFMANGAQHAELDSGRNMTDAEWFDYCVQIRGATTDTEAEAAPEPVTPAPILGSYATDGQCHNAQNGTYGHECGKPAQWIGSMASGFKSGFCDECKAHGHEARNVTTWTAINTTTPPTPPTTPTPGVGEVSHSNFKTAPDFSGDIPLSLAVSAYNGVSMSPDRRGQSAKSEYADSMTEDYAKLQAQAVKGGTLDLLPEVFARYRARQGGAYRAYLASSSRCVSSFIAGPSNFPAARMNKRADICHRRLNEYLDGGKMALQAAIRTLRPDLRAIISGDVDAIDRLTVKIESAERAQASMKEANKAIRTHAKAGEAHQVAALMEIGYSEALALELLHPRFNNGQGFPTYSLTNNNANIRRMKERLEQISKAQSCEVVTVKCEGGISLEDDAPANRVRLFFPGKPAEEIRADLKSNGFRWAPSLGAWQAYRNNSTLATARRMAGEPVTDDAPELAEKVEAPTEATPTAPDTLDSFDDTAQGISQALLDSIDSATAEQVQALTAEQFQKLYDHLENWNFHTENYMLEALRLGDESIILDMRQVVKDQTEAGYLRDDIGERRQAITERMKTLKNPPTPPTFVPQNPPEKTGGWEGSPIQISNPDRFDLAIFVAAGIKPETLIGLGVWCSGDMANPAGSGAITGIFDPENLEFTITLESGQVWRAVRSSEFKDGWFSLDGKQHGAPYLAQLAATVASAKASASSAKEQANKTHAQALIDLAAQYPQLKRADTSYAGGKLAAANMRLLLKAAFKGQKFSVTSDYNSVRVSWEDGPTDKQVTAIIGRFDIGAADTQSDYFYTIKTAFSDLFGGVQYLFTNRHESDALIQRAIDQVYALRDEKPTTHDYRKCTGIFEWNMGQYENRQMRDALNSISLTPTEAAN
jgi:hypothetical protein